MEPSLFTILTMRIKKLIAALLSLLFILTVTSCNLPHKTVESTVDQEPTEITYSEIPVEKGQKIVTDKFELIIDKTIITKEADSNDLGLDIKLNEKDGNIYYILFGTIKNISSSAISFSNLVATNLIFDEKYEYSVSYSPSNLSNIVPLKTEFFIWYSSVPMEVLTSTSIYKFKWDILSGVGSGKTNIEYTFSGENNQYLSVENIDNFHIFTEVIKYIVKNNTKRPVTIATDDKANDVIISSKRQIKINLPDDEYGKIRSIIMTPRLSLNYDRFIQYTSGNGFVYGLLEMYFFIEGKSFVVLKNLTFSSDTGSFDIIYPSHSPNARKDGWALFNHNMSSEERLSEFINIINGNNPHVSVSYSDVSLDIDEAKVNIDLKSDTDIEEINNLLTIYSKCPDSPFQSP